MRQRPCLSVLACCAVALAVSSGETVQAAAEPNKVSYYRQVRPIFQVNCQGCHQPAKASGGYEMTSLKGLLKGGDGGEAAIVPGQPEKSVLLEMVTPKDGKAEMPQGRGPLATDQIGLVRRWIQEGAIDDTPVNARQQYDQQHPPVYYRPPVIASLDFSPDGKLLAVAGFHETVLWQADGAARVARLVGLADRIETVHFSRDGSRLLVVGGNPCRAGEIQIWDVAQRKLVGSHSATADTLYGGCWSPDGTLIAFGGADNALRAVETNGFKPVVFMAAHDDWIRGAVFSADGKSLLTAGRDMTVKMTDVATQRFLGNLTTHTPGVLRGGMQCIDRHPKRNEVIVGSADGSPKLFKMEVTAAAAGGGNPNQIREYEAMLGRVFDVRFSPDGSRFFAAASLDGKGQVRCYETDSGRRLWQVDVPEGGMYAVACSADGVTLAAAGADGQVRLLATADGQVRKLFLPVELSPAPPQPAPVAPVKLVAAEIVHPSFVRDVQPILAKMGCNTGTCHGSAKGKNGFKLSLRGYDPAFDHRALTDDLASRRVNAASPDDSLMLLKPTAAVPHGGGGLMTPDSPYYRVLRQWIADGAKLDLSVARVAKIDVLPKNPTIEAVGGTQPMQVTATYTDGATRDVTGEAFIESGNTEVAAADGHGRLTALRRGEAPVLARYEGAYAATTLTVMGDRNGFAWQQPEAWNKIDELVAGKWQRMKIVPSGLCGDAEFLRRVHLDLTGLPPTVAEVRAFLKDPRETREKRYEVIDRLIGSEAFVEHWTNKWADLLQVNRKHLGPEGAAAWRQWIRGRIAGNVPYDEFVRAILTATGSTRENPAASYFKILREPQDAMEATTHLFLGVRFNCNKCHDHPFERWTQTQYYETAAYFARVELKPDPASGDRKIGGTDVESPKPLFEIVGDKPQGEIVSERTKAVAAPKFPFSCKYPQPAGATRRQELAAWLTSPDNPYFARSYVNRLWGYLLGVGLIEPLDDIRAGNPPTNPELLDYLTQEFTGHGFDARHVMRLICQSRTYQLSIETGRWNDDDRSNYSHAFARRLPAEVLFDSIYQATGSVSRIPGVPPGTRAAALPDSGINLPDGFLTNLGRPPRESPCECERSTGLQLGPVMALISGPTVETAIADPNSELAKLAVSEKDDGKLIDEIFLRVLGRPASPKEIEMGTAVLRTLPDEHKQLAARLAQLEQETAAATAQQEKQRQEAIARTKSDLEAYEKQIAAQAAEQERRRQQRIAEAEAAVRQSEARLPERLAAWERQAKAQLVWVPLDPINLSATNGAQLAKQPDLSVLATGPNGKGTYQFVGRTDLGAVTGLRLEALADDRLPMKGPGRAPNGNFVVSEIKLEWAPAAEPNRKAAVALQNPQADFSQSQYEVQTAIDGKNDSGWAISPRTGESHTAVFETRENAGAGPGLFTLTMVQEFADGQHSLGRFRVSVTAAPRPVGLQGLPKSIADILALAPDKRTEPQKAELLAFYRSHDGELKSLAAALEAARQPPPVDPKLVQLREALAQAGQPLPVDPALKQLRDDVQLSAKQLETARITFAQDLTWALINSPAFLFNR